MKKEIVLNGSCLYTPGGAAREYAAVGCNFYRGCPYQCRYCYNRKGITSSVLGIDHAVLEDKFTKASYRPKKYATLPDEYYAFMRFCQETDKHLPYLQQVGIFFSFSTDPLCPDTLGLTWRSALYAVEHGIPVKILTKNADFTAMQMLDFGRVPADRRTLISFGYTLTGRDDWEPFASPNVERVRMLRIFKEMGFHTFASIEPVVDFDSSYAMVNRIVRFCDQFLIGLMSKPGTELSPYSKEACSLFIYKTDKLVSGRKAKGVPRIYWKESVRKFMEGDDDAMQIISYSPVSVGRGWSLFTGKDTEGL